MKTIYLEIENKQVKQPRNIQSQHLWYDQKERKLNVLQGGTLRFKYDLNEAKMIPYVEDVKITSYKKANNREAVFSWIKRYSNLITINASETTSSLIAIDIEDGDESYVIDLINREGFRYD